MKWSATSDDPMTGTPPRSLLAELDRTRVFRKTELRDLIRDFRSEWKLAEHSNADAVIEWLTTHTKLHEIHIRSDIKGRITRYVWGEVSSLAIAYSLAPKGYFCHATAAAIHGLLTHNPETIYLNVEQSAKPITDFPVTQDGINRAFAKRQRVSRNSYTWSAGRVAVVNGKQSSRLGVESRRFQDSEFAVTGVERTLVDLTVRPDYAGGPAQVLEAFKRARELVSGARILQVLDGLSYKYPYHQAVGFYMHRAGYGDAEVAVFRNRAMSFDFYVGYGVAERDFDVNWRIHFPRSL